MMANAVTPTSGTVITFVGAGVGYLLRFIFGSGHWGTALLLVTSGVAFATAAAIATTMGRSLLGPAYDPDRPQTREALRNVVRGLVDGLRHIARQRAAAATLGAMSTHRFMYGMCTAMLIMLYRYHFTTDDPDQALAGVALVLGASGVGYFGAALITPWATERFGITNWVPMVLAAAGVLGFALVAPFQEWGMPIAGFVLGVAGQSVKICADTTVQRDIADAYLGRVFSLYDMLFNGMYVLAAAFAAMLLPPNGRSFPVLAIIAAGYIVGALVYRVITPADDGRRQVPQSA
jgi:hypothetical protein